MFRRSRRPDPEPPASRLAGYRAWAGGLAEPWRGIVERALSSRERYDTMLVDQPEGPTRQRLEETLPVLDDAVEQVVQATVRALKAAEIASGPDVAAATDELKRARRELDVVRASGGDTGAAERLVDTLATRHRALHEALNLAEAAGTRLGGLVVQLETLVAQASTVVLRSNLDQPGDLHGQLDRLITEMSALDAALRELAW